MYSMYYVIGTICVAYHTCSRRWGEMAAAPSDDDMPQCPLCHMILRSKNELQLHYLQSCAGYDNAGGSEDSCKLNKLLKDL